MALFLTIIISFAFLVIPRIDGIIKGIPYNVDLSMVATISRILNEGGVFYRDAIDVRGALSHYYFALLFKLGGTGNMQFLNFMLLPVLAFIAFMVYKITLTLSDDRSALFALMLFSVASTYGWGNDVMAHHPSWVMVAGTSFGFLAFLYALIKEKFSLYFLSGLVYGTAFFIKQQAVSDFMGLTIFILSLAYFKRNKNFIYYAIGFLSGFAAIAVAVSAYFLFHGVLKEYVYYCFIYNSKMGQLIPFQEKMIRAIDYPFRPDSYVYFVSFVFYPTFIFAISTIRNFTKNPKKDHLDIALLVVCVFSYLGASILSGKNYGYYYFQMLPFFCVATGIMLARGFDVLPAQLFKNKNMLFCMVLFIFFLFFPLWNKMVYASNTPMDIKKFPWFSDVPMQRRQHEPMREKGFRRLIEYMRSNSTADDSLFVWGFWDDVYLRSGIRPATRYINTTVLAGFSFYGKWSGDYESMIAPGSWEIFEKDIKLHKPKFIVDASTKPSWGFEDYPPALYPVFKKILDEEYVLVKEFGKKNKKKYLLYERKNP